MSLHYIYSDAVASTIDITDRCRLYQLSGKEQAEEGATPISTLVVDDPDGDIEFTGHRRLYIYEDEAPYGGQVIYYGWTANERVARGPNRIGAGRQWTLDLADPNVLLNRRVMNGTDANRPAETDIERITALLGMTELDTISDTTYFNTGASATAMDAVDYRGQNVGDYIDDCRQASGKNAFVFYSEAFGGWGLWYDFASSTEYDSGCFLTTDEGQEVDDIATFGYSVERTYLNRDPSRVASGIYLDWEGKPPVYVQDTDTRDEFTAIDWAAPSLNVKSLAKATARANRYLADAATEHEIIHTVMTHVPRASVNAILKGQLVQFKAEYMPGFVTYRSCRVLYRQVNEISEDPDAAYEIEMELDPQPLVCPESTPSGFYPPNLINEGAPGVGHMTANGTGNVFYERPGIAKIEVPTPGAMGVWHFSKYNQDGGTTDYAGDCVQDRARCLVIGDGTMTIHTAEYLGTGRTLSIELQHRAPGGIVTDLFTDGFNAGDDIVVNVSTHDEEFCAHWVRVHDTGPACGSKWGFKGFDWVLA